MKTTWFPVPHGYRIWFTWGLAMALPLVLLGCPKPPPEEEEEDPPKVDPTEANATDLVREGRAIFRHDTFGSEAFWGGTLRLHETVQTLTPRQVLSLGLKVDVEALPQEVVDGIQSGEVDLDAPATTLALLQLNSVLGVDGTVSNDGTRLETIGITCALCHSTVDDALAPGIGKRLDGWANRDLDVGAIINAAPDLSAVGARLGVPEETVRTVVTTWGPGKFDAALFLDGIPFNPDGETGAVLIPPAFGLLGVNQHTWTGFGSITYWNAFVAVLEMGGQGTFYDPRLMDETRFPVAAANGSFDVRPETDLVTRGLGALQFYQLALPVPAAPAGSFDAAAATRGQALFAGKADCARCHVPPIYTEPGWNMHTADEIGIDSFQSDRAPDGRYRTAPLRGLHSHTKGGFYHDGRFPTLQAVVEHYDGTWSLGLTDTERADLVQFLLSL